jgi:anaerobic selenocysteine-containing dehydrogenase
VAPFTSERVAPLAGVPAAQITAVARTFAKARRGNATSGTGPSMAPYGVLMDYLVLALNTVCGRWVRAGELLPNRGVLFRQFSGVARAEKPRPGVGLGQRLRIRSLTETAAGLPTSALADEILTPGEGQVRALIVVGGNPLLSWPNQAKTRRALESLDLLVVVDPQVSATGRLAHYVLGPRFGLEEPAMSFGNEGITTYGLSIGYQEPYAQYQPRLIEPPEGAEVLAEDLPAAVKDAALIASAQRVEHYEMAAYGTLVAWAQAMGHSEAAALLQQTLDEEKAADQKLSKLAEGGINSTAAELAHGELAAAGTGSRKGPAGKRKISR